MLNSFGRLKRHDILEQTHFRYKTGGQYKEQQKRCEDNVKE